MQQAPNFEMLTIIDLEGPLPPELAASHHKQGKWTTLLILVCAFASLTLLCSSTFEELSKQGDKDGINKDVI